jgi:hypothetical protein
LIEFTDSTYFTGPEVTDEMIAVAESRLGVRLPRSYVSFLRVRNGGETVRHCYPVGFPVSWAEDQIDVGSILGVGGTRGIDADLYGLPSSMHLIKEWGYPPIGVVICATPSGGHDTVMLDYSGEAEEPSVAYVDEDRIPRLIAASFEEFLAGLVECPPAMGSRDIARR